jgi:predicted dehydrogenase
LEVGCDDRRASVRTPIRVAVVGLGNRGASIVAILDSMPQVDLQWLCDHDPAAQLRWRLRYSTTRITSDVDEILNDEDVDGIVVSTPSVTHYDLVRRALEADKHVLVEKPLALRSDQADDLVQRAEERDRCLVVGNTRLFHPAVRRLKKLLSLGRLGDLYYLHADHRESPRKDEHASALWKLGSLDVPVVLHLLGDEPVEVSAAGGSYEESGIIDVVSCQLAFATGIAAHIHLSLLDPRRVSCITAIGSKAAATFDDGPRERALTLRQRSGDIVSPRLTDDEPSRLECEHFLNAVRSPAEARATPREGAAMVSVLEALQRSLDNGAAPTPVHGGPRARTPVRASGGGARLFKLSRAI